MEGLLSKLAQWAQFGISLMACLHHTTLLLGAAVQVASAECSLRTVLGLQQIQDGRALVEVWGAQGWDSRQGAVGLD